MKSPLTLERLAQGEIFLETSPDEELRLRAMEDEDRTFLEAHPALPDRPRLSPTRILWFPAGAAALLLAVFGLGTLTGPTAPDTRAKGAALSLFVYHKTPTGTELLGPEARLGQGDEIQIAFFSAVRQYAAIVSVDGRGTVTTHLPVNDRLSLEVETSKPELLPYSYRLDDAPDFENLYLVASPEPFALDRIRTFFRAGIGESGENLSLPSGFTYTWFRIMKKESSR